MQRKPQPKRLSPSASAPSFIATTGSFGQSKEDEAPSLRPGRMAATQSMNFSASAPSVALYATPSFSSLYVDPEDLEPGPGTYDVPDHHLSTHLVQPSMSITAKHSRSWDKVMITKDHLNTIMARGTPGPGTYQPGILGSQARIRFGTSKRRALSNTNFRAPGPVYEVTGDPDNPAASVKFGKASRFDMDGATQTKSLGETGPGQYELSTVFDGTKLAKSFGASHRAYDRVRFPGSERMEIGKASPGPSAAQPFQNTGRSVSFSRAERLPDNRDGKRAPGPGAYENHERQYPFSRNLSVFSFGRPHPRGRIDFKQMRHHTNSCWGVR